jgi:uncharacterized protein DUF4157/succinylglutamate desuccinylase/aspartoacylase family protein
MLKHAARRSSLSEAEPTPARKGAEPVPTRPLAWSWVLQPKLRMGAVDDPLEREADQVAEATVQRKCAACEEEEMQRSPAELPAEDEEEKLQTKRSSGAAPEVSPQTVSHIANFRGGGEALSPAAKAYFEPAFGRDLSVVRLHTGTAAARAAGEVGARAFTVGSDIAFGAGEYRPETAEGRKLLAHELTHTVQQGRVERRIQRSPLSDSVKAAWTADPTLEALLARLSQADVQGAQTDADVDAEVARLLAGRADDLWVAQRVRQGELGKTASSAKRSIQAVFIRGTSARRALVIAGVHGSERQGIEVAQTLIKDLQTKQPHFTVIVVPSLFPDNAAAGSFGSREGSTPTNRNFPKATQDLAAARKGGGKAVDAEGRAMLPENVLLLELMERFQPERIISIHGTKRPGAAGVFYDPRKLTSEELEAARDWATEKALKLRPASHVQYTSEGREEEREQLKQAYFEERVAQLTQQASDADRDLSLKAATQIDTATAGIAGRENRKSFIREDEEADPSKVPAADLAGRKAHPSVAGNIGPTGAMDHASWSGGTPKGVSLGEYAPPRGMSVFTVEPPINRNTGDYPTAKDTITAAQRKLELQSYTDAVRTVLLGAP